MPGSRGTNSRESGAEGDPRKRPIGGTALALVLGIVLMAAALLLPSTDAPDAVPGDGLQPVVSATTDPAAERGGALPESTAEAPTSPVESWQAVDKAPESDPAAADDGHGDSSGGGAAGGPGGSSSASVAGDDIDRASREEAQRQRAARRRAKARRAARAREAARAKRDRSRASQPQSVPPEPSSAAPPAPQVPPRAASPAPARSASPRRSPPNDSPAKEFAGGL